MQSAVPHVLKVLDRTHTPSRVPQVVAVGAGGRTGREPGPDLRHAGGVAGRTGGTPLETALSYEPDHISAYALIVEDGTKLAAQIRRGEVPGIDDDDHAAKYELADELIAAAGLQLVRGQQLVAHAGAGLPAQPRLLARGRLVGDRPRRALARGRRALVERQAPHRLRGPAASRGSRRLPAGKPSTPRPGSVERIMLADPAGRSRHPALDGLGRPGPAGSCAADRRGARGPGRWRSRGCWC